MVLVLVFTAVRTCVRIRRMGKDCACLSVVLVLSAIARVSRGYVDTGRDCACLRMLTCPLWCSTDARYRRAENCGPRSCSSSIRSRRLCWTTETGTHSATVHSSAAWMVSPGQLRCSFWGPAHRCRAEGRVHRDTAPIIRCMRWLSWINMVVIHTGPHHNHHNHHHHNNNNNHNNLRGHFGSNRGFPQRISAAWSTVLCHLEQANKVHSEFASVLCARFGMPIAKVPVSKFDEPEPGAVSGAVAEPHQMFVGWNSVKQLATILGLCAATFFLLDATASPACLVAATALPVAFGGFALHGHSPVGFCGSCFQHVPMGAAMSSAAMLAAIAFLHTGFRSRTTGLEKDLKGERACCL